MTLTTLPFQVGEPVEHRGIVVTPLYPARDPVARYLTIDEALPQGLAIGERGAGGSVPELVVRNPLDRDVLLYDGEELVGAKQNRILNLSVLVAAGGTVPIPVSCVEEGRWSSRSAFFDSARHVSHAHLRRRKAELLAARPMERGLAQRAVWDEVRAKSTRMRVDSPTLASDDVFAAHRDALGLLEHAFPLQPGQSGAVLALGDTLCLDWVSRPDAFERLWPKLRRGYLLDGLEQLDGPPTPVERTAGFLDEVADAPATHGPTPGLGCDLRLRGPGVIGSGLELDGELLQLCAFTSDGGGEHAFGQIARPSRRLR